MQVNIHFPHSLRLKVLKKQHIYAIHSFETVPGGYPLITTIFQNSWQTFFLIKFLNCLSKRPDTLDNSNPPLSINIPKNHAVEWETPTGPTLYSWRLCLAVFNRLLMDHQSTGSVDMTVPRVPERSVPWQANKALLRRTVAQCHSPHH